MQVDPEARFELPLDHRLAAHLQHPAGRKPAAEHLGDLFRVDAGPLGEQECLTDCRGS